MKIVNLEQTHIEQASELLSAQFGAVLKSFPLLPQRVKNQDVTRDFLAHHWGQDGSCGVAMLEDGDMLGYLLGKYGENPFFGKHVYVPYGGIALKDQADMETLARLYTSAGKHWVEGGIMNHYLTLPALPDWLDAVFSLSFGKEQAYAVASMAEPQPEVGLPAGIVMREAVSSDADALSDCADWICGHYNLAPVWEPVPADHLADLREGYAELADEEETTTWIALDGERIVSFMVICPEDVGPASLFGEAGVTHFPVAATHPAWRGRRIGRALFTHVMNLAAKQGAKIMTTDWRTTNPAAAQYWPKFGFEPYAYRVLRRANPRYSKYSR